MTSQHVNLEESFVQNNFSDYVIIGRAYSSTPAKLFKMEKGDRKYMLKIACTRGVGNGNLKLLDEIDFLESIPEKMKPYFTEVLEKQIVGETVCYIMPLHQDHTTIREFIMKKESCVSLFRSLFRLIFEELYTKRIIKIPTNFYTKDTIGRVEKRLVEAISLNKDIEKLFDSKKIVVNGNSYSNWDYVCRKAMNHYKGLLSTSFSCSIHGDLSIENILVNQNDIKIIDPRGPGNISGYGDYVYDLAKFSYTLGEFSFIKYNEFILSEESDGNYILHFPEEDQTVFNHYRREFNTVLDIIVPEFFENDIYWRYRMLFTEACHYLSNVPCFLNNGWDIDQAKALYIQGILLLNKFSNLASRFEFS